MQILENPEGKYIIESKGYGSVFMVGAFPPPVNGMAVVNMTVRDMLVKTGVNLTIINVSGKNLERSFVARFGRLLAVIQGFSRLLLSDGLRGATLYMSISGGFGKIYEICFLVLARFSVMRLYLHHHSFAYLDKPNWLTRVLINIAGVAAVHITQSPGMSTYLQKKYKSVNRVISLSNAVFLIDACAKRDNQRSNLETLGFISNISEEKGVFEFLDLIAAYEQEGIILNAKCAGTFQDDMTERLVRQRIAELNTVEYVGPKFGGEKDAFFASIDVLIFPTCYDNETEGIVNHEAMSRGIPVIAYGRGCIPEIINSKCGLVIQTENPFVPEALKQIKQWLKQPNTYKSASEESAKQFQMLLDANKHNLKILMNEIIQRNTCHANSE